MFRTVFYENDLFLLKCPRVINGNITDTLDNEVQVWKQRKIPDYLFLCHLCNFVLFFFFLQMWNLKVSLVSRPQTHWNSYCPCNSGCHGHSPTGHSTGNTWALVLPGCSLYRSFTNSCFHHMTISSFHLKTPGRDCWSVFLTVSYRCLYPVSFPSLSETLLYTREQ